MRNSLSSRFSLVVMLSLLLATPSLLSAAVKPASLFSDHMVLQRDIEIPVWGWDDPGQEVTVRCDGEVAKTTADTDGKWSVRLKAMNASAEPKTIEIVGSSTVEINDVLVGEVWLCSGQSNMAWSVERSKDAVEEIESANYPQIRHFQVARIANVHEEKDVRGSWELTTPENVGGFSAAGYYFGRYLHKKLDVPIGLVNSSWGGTAAEAWTPLETLKEKGLAQGRIKMYLGNSQKRQAAMEEYRRKVARQKRLTKEGKLLDRHPDPGNRGEEKGYADPNFDDTEWKSISLPQILARFMDIDGVVWFRREVEIPAGWIGEDIEVHFGAIDDFDVTYFNGVKVGQMGKSNPDAWKTPRKYVIPGKLVQPGTATIAVRLFDDFGGGGFRGTPKNMYLKQGDKKISLAGEWRYKIETVLDPSKLAGRIPRPRGPKHRHAPGSLFGGMIKPLIPFAIRGAIWYQGESNAGRYAEYQELLTTMIEEWRDRWGQGDFPFGIVQLANFRKKQNDPDESSAWARLREAQSQTAQTVGNVGLAVIVDIGEAQNIHPKNKQDVGKRLGLWALATVYDQELTYSGPVFDSAEVDGSRVRLKFNFTGDELVAKGDELKGFVIAGEDGEFHWANAKIDGDSVIVWSDEVEQPTAVRYAFANNPEANLYNSAGLPAVPFRTELKE